jgi:hypothetical protein
MKVKELLSDRKRWTTGAYARSRNRNLCDPKSSRAYSFCLLGAIRKCYGELTIGSQDAIDKLKDAICQLGHSDSITEFNDQVASFEDIQKVLEIANI